VLLEARGARHLADLERAAKRLPRVGRAARPAQLGAQRPERPRPFEALVGGLELLHRLLELGHPVLAEQLAEHPQRPAEPGRRAPGARELHLLASELDRLLAPPSMASASAFKERHGSHAGLRERLTCRS
jgi:hypothetical protein